MEEALTFLMWLGTLIWLLGRLMLWNSVSGMGKFWVIMVRFVPFGEMAYLARYWDLARNGAITCMCGVSLAIPYIGMTAFEKQARDLDRLPPDSSLAAGTVTLRKFENLDVDNQAKAVLAKMEKVNQLNAYLGQWFRSMEQKRPTIKDQGAAAVQQFNADATAYRALLAVAKEESDSLDRMRNATNGARKESPSLSPRPAGP